jgi:hypothetical protein
MILRKKRIVNESQVQKKLPQELLKNLTIKAVLSKAKPL